MVVNYKSKVFFIKKGNKMLKEIAEKKKIVNFKVDKKTYEQIKENANQHTGGKVSKWIRYAATNHKPKKSAIMEKK